MIICYKLTASGNIIYSALDYKLMRPVRILRLQKRKNRQKRQIQKELIEKKVERKAIKNKIFCIHFSICN